MKKHTVIALASALTIAAGSVSAGVGTADSLSLKEESSAAENAASSGTEADETGLSYDEAIAQASCIAGYVNRFTDGECLILFMRDKKTPETSYITVEIIDGEVAQAKLAANAAISEKEEAILTEWVDICNKNAVRGEQNGLPA